MMLLRKLLLGVLGLISIGLLAYAALNVFDQMAVQTDSRIDPEPKWSVDAGYRLEYASNPRLFGYEDGVLKLGYEFHASELKNAPGEKGWIGVSYDDGLTFEDLQSFNDAGIGQSGPGIELPNGTYKRYKPDFDQCGITSQSSDDGVHWKDDDGLRYDLSQDDCYMGVWTFFVDDEGGVVLLYNQDLEDEYGDMIIYVRRAYSEPGDNGENFEFEDDNVMEMTYENEHDVSLADPNALVLPDGRVRLILMWQDPTQSYPPLGRQGTIYSFISDDGGRNFDLESEVMSWASVDEFEVRSLNDPKILELEDGSFRIWVAAMIEDEEEESGFKWVMLSATLE